MRRLLIEFGRAPCVAEQVAHLVQAGWMSHGQVLQVKGADDLGDWTLFQGSVIAQLPQDCQRRFDAVGNWSVSGCHTSGLGAAITGWGREWSFVFEDDYPEIFSGLGDPRAALTSLVSVLRQDERFFVERLVWEERFNG